jgi:hypothetical protein
VINILLSLEDPFIRSTRKLPHLTADPEGTAPLTPNAAMDIILPTDLQSSQLVL